MCIIAHSALPQGFGAAEVRILTKLSWKRTRPWSLVFFWNFGQLKHIIGLESFWELSQDPMINSNLPQNFSNKDYYISTKSGNWFLFQHTLILTHTFLENQDSKSRFTYTLYSTPSKHETQFLVFLGIRLIQQTQPNKRHSEHIIKISKCCVAKNSFP